MYWLNIKGEVPGMAKVHGHGQAEILSEIHYARVLKQLRNPKHKLFFMIARYTGERWGAITQLRVSDVYSDPSKRTPYPNITFRASTRKSDPDGRRETRQVPIHEILDKHLRAYEPPLDGWLFPSASNPYQHFSLRNADEFFRRALGRAGLADLGYSTHSTRRSFITKLSNSGVSVPVIKSITGHKSLAALQRYIEVSPDQRLEAIGRL